MATVTDSIINIVIIIAAVIALSIIVTTTILKNTTGDLEQDQKVWFEERTNYAVDAILDSTENNTGKTMGTILGEAMFTLRTNISTPGGESIDVKQELQDRMDNVFGEDMYYIRVKPVVQGVNMIFVLDSSPTVAAERDTIAQNLQDIQEDLENQIDVTGRERVSIQIYMLPTNGNSACDIFTGLGIEDMECTQWSVQTLYQDLLDEGWERPGFQTGRTYEGWLTQNYLADSVEFASTDWAAGVAAADLEYNRNPFLLTSTSVNMIFPLSDELATSSKHDTCFNEVEPSRYILCTLCEDRCPNARSRDAVDQAITILDQSQSLVFPIYSVNCDYNYQAGYNAISSNSGSDPYISQFMDGSSFTPGDYPGTTWCSQTACGGCNVASDGLPPEPDFCYHDNCYPRLQEDMQLMADATGGDLFNVNDAGDIPNNVLEAFDRILTGFEFQLGFIDEARDRFVYEKIIKLPNGALTRLEIWAYIDPPRQCAAPDYCETENGCPGTRECIDDDGDGVGLFADECVQDDPACVGAPCQAPKLCYDQDDCIGLRDCVDDDGDGWGELSSLCVKVDPTCKAPCVNNCPREGEVVCEETFDGSDVYWKLLCAPDNDGCLRWEPFRVCTEPCEEGVRCGEDPSCDIDCSDNDVCNEACSQNNLCPFDVDCEGDCWTTCYNEGICNLYCSPGYPGYCPLDLDCPSCMNRNGDRCPSDDPGCCPTGEHFIWGKRYTSRGLSHCDRGPCYGQCIGEPPSFGMCCDEITDCVFYDGGPRCIDEGTQMNDVILFESSYLCIDQIMTPCFASEACASGSNTALCIPGVTIDGVNWECNPENGEWEAN